MERNYSKNRRGRRISEINSCLLFLGVLVFSLFPEFTNAKIIIVSKTGIVKTISKGVSLANNKDTIIVYSGIYQEYSIQIKKSIVLIGKGNPVIDGNKKGSIIEVFADSVVISGFKIINVGHSYTHDYAGIIIHNTKKCIIENNDLENVFFGIKLEKAKNCIIRNNKISGKYINEAAAGNGIHIWYGSNDTIIDNVIFGVRDGIYFEFVDNSFIKNNYSHNNLRYGLHFMFSNNDRYENNIFENNGSGVAVMFSKFIYMYKNEFRFNWGTTSYGLLLKEIYDGEIHFNVFKQNTIAINVEGCTRVNYSHNDFLNNGWAIKVVGACYKNIFTKNNFLNNSFDLSYNSNTNDNRFDFNYWSDYTGYDLNKNNIGDIPYRPVKLFSYIVNKTPETIILLRSLFIDIINFSEKVSPIFTPDNLIDEHPLMKKIKW
ncbi:MAG TPA: nitrous oxide reductase family maturation protein NosD [Bacteroidia bacterium]|nr:nitrous oxide reductase family maturation protein NosD [Bacteroidia bacterium]